MAWVSSTFDDMLSVPTVSKHTFTNGDFNQRTKKHCSNMWVEGFAPASIEDLAVHKKKIQEVQHWLMEKCDNKKGKKILLLSGPSGTAKSTTIRVLCKEFKIDIRSWNNSESSKHESLSFTYDRTTVNQTEKFSDFIFRSSKYRNICSIDQTQSALILVEEFPQALIMNPLEFQLILRKYSACCTTPIVFVLSETKNNSLSKSLFPSEFQEEIHITNITFNPVSVTLLSFALNRILGLAGHAKSPFFEALSVSKKEFLQALAERSGGDVRSAINSLQFALMKGSLNTASKRNVKGKKKMNSVPGELLGGKDSSLQLFRALGKVLYCKRKIPEKGMDTAEPGLPTHLKHLHRNPLLENPEDVFERSETEAANFSLFLHHNCIPFFDDITDYLPAIHYQGDADILNTFWEPSNALKTHSASISIRGLMHSLKEKPSGQSQTFRSLNKPYWYTYWQTTKDKQEKIKRLCSNTSISNEEFTCISVPLLAKIAVSSEAAADSFLRDIGLLYPQLPVTKNLPIFSSGVSSSNTSFSSGDTLITDVNPEDEEFHIEEIED